MSLEVVQDRLPATALHPDGVRGLGIESDAHRSAIGARLEFHLRRAIAKAVLDPLVGNGLV